MILISSLFVSLCVHLCVRACVCIIFKKQRCRLTLMDFLCACVRARARARVCLCLCVRVHFRACAYGRACMSPTFSVPHNHKKQQQHQQTALHSHSNRLSLTM